MLTLPNQVSAFVDKAGRIITPWVQYLQQFTQAPPNVMAVTVTASPFSYIAKEPGYVHIDGGVVSAIALVRGAISLNYTGMKSVPVAIKDTVVVIYTGLPTIKFIPSYGQNTGT